MSTNANPVEAAPNWRVKEWFSDIDEKTVQQLRIYFLELLKFNKVVNLISSKSVIHADAIHFADSIISSKIVRKKINNNSMLYDFGSGNGFPGLVYGILYSDQKITLIDSDERKCEFLKHVVETLALKNVTVQNKKIETLPINSVEQAICRGFAPLPRALLILRKAVKVGGFIFHLKSDEWGIEVSQIPIQLCSVWQPVLEGEYKLPLGDIKLYIVRTDKIS